jgi:protoheme IX farnesyltransferase
LTQISRESQGRLESVLPADVAGPAASLAELIRALVQTTKPGITRLVTITSIVGYVMAAAVGHRADGWMAMASTFIACVVGTALSAAGANALNQWWERQRDARMLRTQRRPLPMERVTPAAVLALGSVLSIVGVGVLWAGCGLPAALVSLTCVLVYVLLYTPLKPITSLATYVGAIPGALPPLIGWAASSGGSLDVLMQAGGLSLVALMTVWQIPHFMAIAWMYRDDYAKGGFCVLPTRDPLGIKTSRVIVIWTLLLIPATLAPAWAMPTRLGWFYIAVAALTGLVFAVLAWRLVRSRERGDARRVFFGSIIHLPLLLLAMVGEALVRVALSQ